MQRFNFRRIRHALLGIAYASATIISLIRPIPVFADATLSYSNGVVTGLVEAEVPVPGITVGGSDPTIPMNIYVDDGVLFMTDTTGISFNGSSRGSSLSFSGSVSDMNNALATLHYRTMYAGTKSIFVSLTEHGEVYNPSNGHFYESVYADTAVDWDTAKTAAEALTKNGSAGYLATITTAAENNFLVGKVLDNGWFGATDATTEGDWQWATGPETGTSFWLGEGDGAAVGGLYSNWSGGEPNNSGDEDCSEFYSDGSGWNDLPCGDTKNYFVVEYGADGDLPTAPENVSISVTINEPTSNVIDIASCTDLIDVYNNGNDNRYDTLSLSADIDCDGETVLPMFPIEDDDFGVIGFRGVFDGNNHAMTNVTIDQSSYSNVGLFSYTRDAEIKDLSLSGSISGSNCVGSIAGIARDTTITNVTSSANVGSNGYIGGLVGCYTSEMGDATVSDNVYSGTITADYDTVGGIFGYIESYLDSSLIVDGNSVTQAVMGSSYAIGGIYGYSYGYNESSLTVTNNQSAGVNSTMYGDVGGIGGYTQVEHVSSFLAEGNTVSGPVQAESYVGGLIGETYNYTNDINKLKISNSTLNVDVTATSDGDAGGFVGYADYTLFENLHASGDISGSSSVGGITGEAYASTFNQSTASGTVTASNGYAGGLSGYTSQSEINRSYATVAITATGDAGGGLVGHNYQTAINDSYARGSVTGNDAIGGLVGFCEESTLSRVYATGAVTGTVSGYGVIGVDNSCDETAAFWDTETSGIDTAIDSEVGKSTSDMKIPATFTGAGYDFDTVWSIASTVNDGYPCLQWQDVSCLGGISDDDTDGVSSLVEDAAPNGGDANNDGTPDSQQQHVSSFVSPVSSKYVTVEVASACALGSVSSESESSLAASDSGYNYTSGLINFSADCGTPGYSTTVKIIGYGLDASTAAVRKYNPTTKTYTTVSSATITTETIGGQTAVVATYTVVDGGSLDLDGSANGTIVDPVGLGVLAVGVPNTGFGGSGGHASH